MGVIDIAKFVPEMQDYFKNSLRNKSNGELDNHVTVTELHGEYVKARTSLSEVLQDSSTGKIMSPNQVTDEDRQKRLSTVWFPPIHTFRNDQIIWDVVAADNRPSSEERLSRKA